MCKIILAGAVESFAGIGKQCTSIEAEIHIAAICHYMTKPILHWFSGERESDRERIALGD